MPHCLAFTMFGPSHVVVLCVIIGLAATLVMTARLSLSEITGRRIALALAVLLVFNKIAVYATIMASGTFEIQKALPMHLCDWSAVAGIIALLWRRQLPFELMFFWGLGGTLQATLTPDLNFDFPDIRFFTFFIGHGGTLVGIAFLTLGLRMRPYPASLVRIFVWSNTYLAAAGITDFLTGENYGYLRHKPLNASLMDCLGPWPLYILSLEAVALLSYLVYYLPFFIYDRFRGKQRRTGPLI
jgi:hypothetical integral membrane protein (TIGR02206 family)